MSLDNPHAPRELTEPGTPHGRRGSIKVLHVDDDPDLLDLVSTFLERESEDMTVVTETDVDAGLERLADDDVDCVVSDYQMPGTDGLEFLEAVRETQPDLPFVLYTGKGSEEIASKAVSAGVTDYMQKERGTDQYTVLANRIENAVSRYRAQKQVERGYEALATAREGISILDQNGEFVFVNDVYADIVGYDGDELLGEHWELLYPPEMVDDVRREVIPAIPEEGRWTGETVYEREDGEHILVDHALTRTADGWLICLIRDLSHDDGREGPLVAEDAFVECLFNALDDLFYVLDTDGSIIRVNDRVSDVTGYATDELVSMHAVEVFEPEDRPAIEAAIAETMESGESVVEARILTDDGTTVPYEFRTRRLTDGDGTTMGLVGIGRDISRRKRRERRLHQQARQFEAFGSVLSHDMRNPMTIIEGRLDLLEDEGANPEHVGKIRDALDRLDTLVTDLSSAMKEGDLAGDLEPVDVSAAAESAWAALDAGDADLIVAEAVRIRADEAALERLFDNLLRNALEHAGEDVTVTIGRLPDGFYVADDGPGIPEDERENVFDPAVSSKDGDSGFGLTSVSQIALAHGWTVEVTESQSGGARFEVTGVEVLD